MHTRRPFMASVTITEPSSRPTSAAGHPRPARWQLPAAAAGYLAYALFITWPLALDPGSSVFGGGGGDDWGQLAFLREFNLQSTDPFQPGRLGDLAAPEGLEVSYALNLVTWPSTATLQGLTAMVGAVAALNVFVIAGFVLNGTSMFALARRVTGAPIAAFVAGFGLAFFPFAIVKAQVHQHYMHAWVFVLLAWRLLELSERPSARNGVLAGLAAVVAFSWTPYFALFGLAVYLPFVARDVVRVMRGASLRPRLVGHAASAGIVLTAFALYALVARSAPGAGLPPRPITEAYVYSSRPLELVLPDAQNPVFGSLTGDYLLKHAHGSGFSEFNGYLGLSLLALAAVSLWAAARNRLDPARRATVGVFAAVALAGALLCAPPTANVGPLRLYFPSWVVFQLSDSFRAFSRAVVVIEVGVCLLAAVGLAQLLRGRARSPVRRAAVLLGVTAIVAVDLAAPAPKQNTRVPTPAVYTTLKRQHVRGIVAEYPLLPAEVPDYEPALFQALHGRPILNGYASGSDQEARALGLARLDDPRTPGRLRLLGVRHVVVDERPSGRPDSPPVRRPARGLDLVDRAGGRALYEITSPPARSAVFGGAGFDPPQGEPADQRQWARRADATLLVAANCASCVGTLHFRAVSVTGQRTLVVRDARGAPLTQARISVNAPVSVVVPLRFSRRTSLRLRVEVGSRSARQTTGSPDPRTVGLLLRDAAFVARR
jgi:hypothetical protein